MLLYMWRASRSLLRQVSWGVLAASWRQFRSRKTSKIAFEASCAALVRSRGGGVEKIVSKKINFLVVFEVPGLESSGRLRGRTCLSKEREARHM